LFLSIPNLDDNHKQYIGEGVATGAFLSMASIEYLPTVYDFILGGFFSGLWSLFFIPFFDGFAGKLGTMSWLGFCTYILLKKCILSFIPYCQEKVTNDSADEDNDEKKKNDEIEIRSALEGGGGRGEGRTEVNKNQRRRI
jgi:hypothetical protein